MKKLTGGLKIINSLIVVFLVVCNSVSASDGSSIPYVDINIKPTHYLYNLQNFKLASDSSPTNNCIILGENSISCNSNKQFDDAFTISFNTPDRIPGAYVEIPPRGYLGNLTFEPADGGCSQIAPKNGDTYTCHFKIKSQGYVSGGIIYLEVAGQLGYEKIVKVKIK